MSNLLMCIAFGSTAAPAVWAGANDLEQMPQVGQVANLEFREASTGDTLTVSAEFVYVGLDDEGDDVAYLYAGDLPDEQLHTALEGSAWTQLSPEAAKSILAIVESAPPVAAVHDVLLVIGDPEAVDEDGEPAVQAWNRTIYPDDPLVPMFGERLIIDVFDATEDYSDSDDEDESFDDSDDEDEDSSGEVLVRVLAPIDLTAPGTPEDGYPSVVFYAAKVEAGEAQVGFWVHSIGAATAFDLVEAGWQMLSPEQFDPVEFRVAERVNLAVRTTIVTGEDEDGTPALLDFAVLDASGVREDQYSLMPTILAEHCRAANELNGDMDALIRSWSQEQRD